MQRGQNPICCSAQHVSSLSESDPEIVCGPNYCAFNQNSEENNCLHLATVIRPKCFQKAKEPKGRHEQRDAGWRGRMVFDQFWPVIKLHLKATVTWNTVTQSGGLLLVESEDPAFFPFLSEVLALIRLLCDLIQLNNLKENYPWFPLG